MLPTFEGFLHALFERRQHAGVMRSYSPAEGLGEDVVVECMQIATREPGHMALHDCGNLRPLGRCSEPYAGFEQLPDGGIAANAGEDEHDRWQERFVVEQF